MYAPFSNWFYDEYDETIKYKCIDCKEEQEVELKGLQSFFT